MHKGYKCLDISVGHLYISYDIVFDETIFLFASLQSNACTRLHAKINLLPLNLQPFNLHGHEGHDLHERIDDNPTDVVVVESFVHDLGQNYASGIILMIFLLLAWIPVMILVATLLLNHLGQNMAGDQYQDRVLERLVLPPCA
jgi:hypothetical protein